MTAKDLKFTPQEMRRLLYELDQLDEEIIVPLSEEEVAEIEASYQSQVNLVDQDKFQREHLKELREDPTTHTEEINNLFQRAQKIGLSRKDFAQKLRLGLDVLFKLNLRLINDIPDKVFHILADTLEVNVRTIYTYLTQPPQNLEQIAASSKNKPVASRVQTWEEAISTSNMPEADKEFWLK
jgi:DNA-binding transcriptional regulator YiaG